MIENAALIIFVKNPVLGKVKTRLAADVGDEAALMVYKNLLQKTFEVVHPINVDRFVFYSDFIDNEDIWPDKYYQKFLQDGENLGEKMDNAFKLIFDQWYEHAIIIGSDCYELNSAILEEALIALQSNDCVIGPAKDGGYYLLGLNESFDLFTGVDWSTSKVFAQTKSKLESLTKSYKVLETLSDIDTVEDLKNFRELIKKRESA